MKGVICKQCGHGDNVVILFHRGVKKEVCRIHLRVGSTEIAPQTLRDRLLHRAPADDTISLQEVLPNRAARRRHAGMGRASR